MTMCKYPLRLKDKATGNHIEHHVRCGRCTNCRITRRVEWQTRIMLESQGYPDASLFVTLTYDDQHLPQNRQVDVKVMQQFFKRLRKKLRPLGIKLRYFSVGEYGDQNLRPHYHIALFGIPPLVNYVEKQKDVIEKYKSSRRNKYQNRYTEPDFPQLEHLIFSAWQCQGMIDVQILEEGSAGYVAGYVTKKLTKDATEIPEEYNREFSTMSRNPGIGSDAAAMIAEIMHRRKMYPLAKGIEPPNADWMPVPWHSVIRTNGKTRPLDRYMQKKVVEYFGGDNRTEDNRKMSSYFRQLFEKNRPRVRYQDDKQTIVDFYQSEEKKKRQKNWQIKRKHNQKLRGL